MTKTIYDVEILVGDRHAVTLPAANTEPSPASVRALADAIDADIAQKVYARVTVDGRVIDGVEVHERSSCEVRISGDAVTLVDDHGNSCTVKREQARWFARVLAERVGA